MLNRFALSLIAVAGFSACAPGPTAGGDGEGEGNGDRLDACAATQQLFTVGGEASGMNGPVAVVVDEAGGRIALQVMPVDDSLVRSVEFALVGAAVDDIVGAVTAAVGVVFAGEGSEYGYLRLTDERGVWFEGGRSTSIDGNAQGGGAIGAPFVLGAATGEHCRRSGSSGYNVALHDVAAQLDDGEAIVVDDHGVDGVWRGVDVRVVGVGADSGVYAEPEGTVDGLGPGPHEITTIVGYLYRVRG